MIINMRFLIIVSVIAILTALGMFVSNKFDNMFFGWATFFVGLFLAYKGGLIR